MCLTCNRCRKSYLASCSLGYEKTDSQLKEEKYSCFDERIYNIDIGLHHPDDKFDPYKNEITNYSSMKLHANMAKSERNLRKT